MRSIIEKTSHTVMRMDISEISDVEVKSVMESLRSVYNEYYTENLAIFD